MQVAAAAVGAMPADGSETLTSGSTIATGDAWEHLLAQGGGRRRHNNNFGQWYGGGNRDQTIEAEIVVGEAVSDVGASQLSGNIAATPLAGSVDDAFAVATISSIIDGDV